MDVRRGGRGWAWPVVAGLMVAWVFAVVAAYYVVHKPFTAENARALARTALDVAAWLALSAAAAGLGRRVAGRRLAQAGPIEDLVVSLGLGLGLLSLLVLIIGLAGGLKPWLAWAVVAVLVAANLGPLRDLARRLRAPGLLRAGSPLERLLAGYVALSMAVAFIRALAPPTAWDSLVYHLTGPKLYIEQGRIVGGIDIPYLGFPTLIETLFTLALLLKGPAVAALVHWTYGALALAAIYGLAQRCLTRSAGWLGMAVLVSAPTIMFLAHSPYVDLALLFYELAAFGLALLAWDENVDPAQRRAWLVLAGAASGLAMGVKYTAVLLPAVLAAITLARGRWAGWRPAAGRALVLAAAAGLVALPWFVKSWALTGNPVYPFFFEGRLWDAFRGWFFSRPATGLAYTAPWRLLAAPVEATLLGTEGIEGYAATIGPLLLATLPPLAVVWPRLPAAQRRFAGLTLAVAAPQAALWLAGVAWSELLMQTRLLFPIFGLLALLAGLALDQARLIDRPGISLRRVLSAVVVLVIGLDLMAAGLQIAADNPAAYLAGWQTQDDYLAGHLYQYYDAVEYINAELPSAAKVYFLWEPRSFYVRQPVQPDAILDAYLHLRHLYGDAEGIAGYLRGAGYSYVLLYRGGLNMVVEGKMAPITAEDLGVLDDLQARYLTPVKSWDSVYELYSLD